MLQKPEVSAGLMGRLARMQTLPTTLNKSDPFFSQLTLYCNSLVSVYWRTRRRQFVKHARDYRVSNGINSLNHFNLCFDICISYYYSSLLLADQLIEVVEREF